MPHYVLDTNLYIAADRDIQRADELMRFTSACLPAIFLHGVVVQEVLAGAISLRREKLVHRSLIEPFERRRRIVTPGYAAWKQAGHVMGQLVQRKLMSAGGFKRSFPNDCLLAASCRDEGLTLITDNIAEFKLIRRVMDFRFEPPWPDFAQ